MDPESPAPESPTPLAGRAALALGAAAVLIWRIAELPATRLWRDAALILALYGLFLAFGARARLRLAAGTAVSAFLLGLYVQGQWPHLVALLRTAP